MTRLLALPGFVALATLAAAPAGAAVSGQIWLPLCSGGETHWLAIPAPGEPRRDDRQHNLCAHASCPRETKLGRKARLP